MFSFFLRMKKMLNKQSSYRWFETPWRSCSWKPRTRSAAAEKPAYTGSCITNIIATCRKTFSQWERSFLWKLRCHWLKFLRHVAKTLAIQRPGRIAAWHEVCHKYFRILVYMNILIHYLIWNIKLPELRRISLKMISCHGVIGYHSILVSINTNRLILEANLRKKDCLIGVACHIQACFSYWN